MNAPLNPALSVVPGGLLDALGIQNTGAYPQQLTQQLVPVLDLLPWYFAERARRSGFTNQNLVAIGNAITWDVAVPPGEVWYVHQLITGVQILAADGVTIAVQAQQPNAASFLRGRPAVSRGIVEVVNASLEAFWAPPGTQFQTVVLANTAPSAASVGGWVYYTPFRR